ncbi:MAG: hypothetical protein MUP81_01715 [Dehalococcoidia bacterium]|nr:hypothetical protein [Dehalococcoidia bacterium]
MKTYNGHRSWNAWNVSLWMGNDEMIYKFALECIKITKKYYEGNSCCSKTWILRRATRAFMNDFAGQKTPDGAVYNALSVKLALEGFMEE